MTCPENVAIGAYVLGALDTGERLDFERHLKDCAECREALLQFANLPGLLHGLTLEEVTSAAFDPDLEQSLAAGPGPELGWLTAAPREIGRSTAVEVPDLIPAPDDLTAPGDLSFGAPDAPGATQRAGFSRRRALLATAAAIVVVLGGVLIGRGLVDDPVPPQAQAGVMWSATDGVGGIDTTVRLSNQSWGTGIQLQMRDLEQGQLCQLVVHARGGQSETAGWWTTAYTNQADVPASTSIALADIDHIDVVTAAGTVLTTLTPSTR